MRMAEVARSGVPAGVSGELSLVRQAQAGNRQAFERLVATYADAVIRTAYLLVTDRDDAEDVAQETFLAAYRALPGYRPEAPFGAWLHRIAVNRSYDLLRKRQRRGKLVDEIATESGGREEDLAIEHARVTEQGRELRALLETLDEKNRAIVSLRFLEDMSIKEIASVVQMPEGTIKRRLHDVLKLLRARMVEGAAR